MSVVIPCIQNNALPKHFLFGPKSVFKSKLIQSFINAQERGNSQGRMTSDTVMPRPQCTQKLRQAIYKAATATKMAATAAATELRPAAAALAMGVGVLEPAGDVGVREGTTPVPAGWLWEGWEPVPTGTEPPGLEAPAEEELLPEGAAAEEEAAPEDCAEVAVAEVWLWLPPVAAEEAPDCGLVLEAEVEAEAEAEAELEELLEPEPPSV